jgi:hypothetical protein
MAAMRGVGTYVIASVERGPQMGMEGQVCASV